METRSLWFVALTLAACGAESEVTDSSPAGTSSVGGGLEALLVESAHPDFVVHVPARADLPFSVKNKRFGAELQVRIEGATDAPRTGEHGEWTYRDALGEGSDLVLAQTSDGLEDWVRLAKPGRVAYRVALGASIAGLRSLGPSVEFLDAKGTPVLRVGNAFAIDHAGERAELSFKVEGCDVDTDPRMPWGRPVRAAGSRECVLAVEVPGHMQGPVWVDPLWTMTDNLTVARWGAVVAIAGSGAGLRVLAIGGKTGPGGNDATNVVEAYDPTTVSWSQLTPLDYTTIEGRAVTLPDGRLVLIGGNSLPGGSIAVSTTKIFDPSTSTWVDAANMLQPRRRHTATVLTDGRVLVAGGEFQNNSFATAEVFDPIGNTWTATGSMATLRSEPEAIRMPNGKVLITGGYDSSVSSHDTSETWNPELSNDVGGFEPPIVMPTGTYGHGLSMLGTDRVLYAGGEVSASGGLATHDQVFDIATETWSSLPTGSNRVYGGIANLSDGSVVVFGGCNHNPDPFNTVPCVNPFDSTRLYPANGGSVIELEDDPLSLARAKFGAVALPDGRVLVAGGGAGSFGIVTNQTDIFALLSTGGVCTRPQQCASGFCVDFFCCESACNGVCESCAVIGTAGQCVAYASGTDPDGECVNDGAACEKTGECGQSGCEFHASSDCEPTPCQDDDECKYACSDGICCDVACDTNCASCRAVDTGQAEGECHPILRGTDPAGECIDGMAGDCSSQLLCDGSYQCIQASSLCAPYVCTEQGCEESCDDDDDCGETFVCVAGACIDESGLCTNETIGLSPDGTVVDCAPFRCKPDGSCLTGCDSLKECEPGLVCDDTTASCVEPPSASGGDEGCVCTVRSLEGGSLKGLAPWLLLLVATRRARRRLG